MKMRTMRICLAALALLRAAFPAEGRGDTFLVIVEEFRNGEAVEMPLPSQEGLMSGMFDLGHITFETGTYRPDMDWDSLDFAEPLSLTREGLGRYLAVARVVSEVRPRQGEWPARGDGAAEDGVEITAHASYLLFDARSSRLIGRGQLQASSIEGERALTYDELLFATGVRLARALVTLGPGVASP